MACKESSSSTTLQLFDGNPEGHRLHLKNRLLLIVSTIAMLALRWTRSPRLGHDHDDGGDGDNDGGGDSGSGSEPWLHVNDDHVKDHDNCDDNNINADPLYLGLLGGVGQSVVWMSIAYTLLEI